LYIFFTVLRSFLGVLVALCTASFAMRAIFTASRFSCLLGLLPFKISVEESTAEETIRLPTFFTAFLTVFDFAILRSDGMTLLLNRGINTRAIWRNIPPAKIL
jgi:hypothetical protein